MPVRLLVTVVVVEPSGLRSVVVVVLELLEELEPESELELPEPKV